MFEQCRMEKQKEKERTDRILETIEMRIVCRIVGTELLKYLRICLNGRKQLLE